MCKHAIVEHTSSKDTWPCKIQASLYNPAHKQNNPYKSNLNWWTRDGPMVSECKIMVKSEKLEYSILDTKNWI